MSRNVLHTDESTREYTSGLGGFRVQSNLSPPKADSVQGFGNCTFGKGDVYAFGYS